MIQDGLRLLGASERGLTDLSLLREGRHAPAGDNRLALAILNIGQKDRAVTDRTDEGGGGLPDG